MLLCTGILLGIATDLHIRQIEDDVEFTITLGKEIIVDGTLERTLYIILGIENLIPLLHRGNLIICERTVIERHKYSQLVTLTMIIVTTRCSALTASTAKMNRTRCAATTPLQRYVFLCNS